MRMSELRVEQVKKIKKLISKQYELNESLINKLIKTEKVKISEADEISLMSQTLMEEITEAILLFIAGYQPLSDDLLFAKSSLKITYDLYRVSRYLREIVILDNHTGILSSRFSEEVRKSLELASQMLRMSIESYMTNDIVKARRVIELDKEIDNVYLKTLDELKQEECLPSIVASKILLIRHIERIADHATYVAMQIIM